MTKIFQIAAALIVSLGASTAAELPEQIANAVKNDQKEVVIERGIYRFDKMFELVNLKNLIIDFNNSEVIFTKDTIGFLIEKCDNITLKNLSVDFDPLPFTQGKVLSYNDKTNEITVKLHDGYPEPKRLNRLNCHTFDPVTRNWKVGAKDFFGCSAKATGNPGEYLVKLSTPNSNSIEAGDLVAFDWRTKSGFEIKGTKDLTMSNVTIYTAGGLTILGRFTTGKHRFDHVTIKRGNTPAGATEPRLLSGVADGINYAYCETGPDITNCDFSYIGDDSVNFHSVALPIVKIIDDKTILVLRPYPTEGFPEVVKPGMTLRLMQKDCFKVLQKAELVGMKMDKTFEVSEKETSALFAHYNPEKDPRRTIYRITVKTPMQFEIGQFIDIPELCGANYTIKNNYFHDHRARAIRMMASNGVIENNKIERIKQNAITIGGEYAFWREAGWCENVTVRNNFIKDVGQDERMTSPGSYAPGAISIIMRSENGANEISSCNKNITIQNNVINGCSSAGIVLHAVDGALVKDNKISNVCTGNVAEAGKNYGFTIAKPIEVTPSAINVKLESNQ